MHIFSLYFAVVKQYRKFAGYTMFKPIGLKQDHNLIYIFPLIITVKRFLIVNSCCG